jgi:asparagine synthase (glutamine-hydrolysing)
VSVVQRRVVDEGDAEPMCGICGVCAQDARHSAAWLERAIAAMRYRGPDACGRFEGENGAIAQARLAIIDLATGDPPLTDESGSIGAVLNGEIYNFRALREQLLVVLCRVGVVRA